MNEAADVDDLLFKVKEYRKERNYSAIVDLLRRAPGSVIGSSADLSLALASALTYLRRHAEAKPLLDNIGRLLPAASNARAPRLWRLLMGIQLIEDGELTEAEVLLHTALTDAESARDETMIADANNCLGILASFRGRVDLAMVYYGRSLLSSQTLGDSQRAGFAHYNLGLVLREWGQPNAALDHFNRAEEFFEAQGTVEERLHVKSERSLLALDLGDPVLAEHLARNALTESAEIQAPVLQAAAFRSLASILIYRKAFTEALAFLKSALDLMGEARGGLVKAEIYEEMALLYLSLNDVTLGEGYRAAAEREYARIGSYNHIDRLNRRVNRPKPS